MNIHKRRKKGFMKNKNKIWLTKITPQILWFILDCLPTVPPPRNFQRRRKNTLWVSGLSPVPTDAWSKRQETESQTSAKTFFVANTSRSQSLALHWKHVLNCRSNTERGNVAATKPGVCNRNVTPNRKENDILGPNTWKRGTLWSRPFWHPLPAKTVFLPLRRGWARLGSIAIVFPWKSLAKTNWATWATALSQVFLLSSRDIMMLAAGKVELNAHRGRSKVSHCHPNQTNHLFGNVWNQNPSSKAWDPKPLIWGKPR